MSKSYQALYRKWRPLVFGDISGQEHISEALRNSIVSGRISHAYLFCGTRGTGKTSTAKIFARAVNCQNPKDGNPCNECDICRGIIDGSILDVYEMDAASNRGVDNIREIREEVSYTPTSGKYKVYIIDETHMLSTEAFNALLKTLEEPPEHVIFILATTEAHKIPATILSRCQRFDFRRIDLESIERRLSKIIKEEDIKITPDAVELIAELADGSMRDGLSILDQCAAYAKGELKYSDIVDIIGIADKRVLFPIVDKISEYNSSEALKEVDAFLKKGKEATDFLEELIFHFRALMLVKSMESPGELLERSEQIIEKYKAQAEKFSTERIISSIKLLSEYLFQAKRLSSPKVAVEMAVVLLCSKDNAQDLSGLLARIQDVEEELNRIKANGVSVKKVVPQKETISNEPVLESQQHIDEGRLWTKWPEALSYIKEQSKSLYMYLFSAKALFYGDEIELVVTSDLGYGKINTADGKKYLSDVFSKIEGSMVKVTVSGKEGPKERTSTDGSILDIVAKKDLLGDKMTIIED